MKSKSLIISTIVFFSCTNILISQQQTKKPKLIIGIVVDQMRAEYLYRFQEHYTENGFKKLIRDGFNVKNAHYNYIPTTTGAGHASIYTGTTPANHGIVANTWYNRKKESEIYCVEDTSVFLIDLKKNDKTLSVFSRSPKNLLTTTITDELKLFTNGRSKVIGVSLKDRGAILPSGHLANGAYWYNSNNGNFVTSSYYQDELPKWLQKFNELQKADSLLNLQWKTYLPIHKYKNSDPDNVDFEKVFIGKSQSAFPYDLKKLRNKNGNYGLITEVPQGNTLLTELVKATIKGEHLGKNNNTDFLTISYSSTDYVGHHFGIRSKELEDTYVRMDNEIAVLLKFLDQKVGKGNYTLFLTADHGASDHPIFLRKKRISGEFYNPDEIKYNLNKYLSSLFGKAKYVSYIDNMQLYLSNSKKEDNQLIKEAVKFLKEQTGIKEVFVPKSSNSNLNNSIVAEYIKSAYNNINSGDIIYQMHSGWMQQRAFGTTHGNSYTSDTHVPLLWYGCNIPRGETVVTKTITQIAPTLSMLLDIPLPNSSNRKPIKELFQK